MYTRNILNNILKDIVQDITNFISTTNIFGSFTVSDETPALADNVTFTITLSSSPVGTYSLQLTKNGVNVSGATTSPYQITNWQESNNGVYRWVVTDSGTSEVRIFGPKLVTAPEIVGSGHFGLHFGNHFGNHFGEIV